MSKQGLTRYDACVSIVLGGGWVKAGWRPVYLADEVDAVIDKLDAEVVEWRGQRDQWGGLCVTLERRIKQLDEEAQDYSDRLEKGEFLTQAKNDRIERLQSRCAELEAEVERLRADAERYRWLRDKASEAPDDLPCVANATPGDCAVISGAVLDAAIDAARGGA